MDCAVVMIEYIVYKPETEAHIFQAIALKECMLILMSCNYLDGPTITQRCLLLTVYRVFPRINPT